MREAFEIVGVVNSEEEGGLLKDLVAHLLMTSCKKISNLAHCEGFHSVYIICYQRLVMAGGLA